MTKLEEKLIQLGYEKYDNTTKPTFYKNMNGCEIRIMVNWNTFGNKIVYSCVKSWTDVFSCQLSIDNLQQAFNQLQNDLKELKEYENI